MSSTATNSKCLDFQQFLTQRATDLGFVPDAGQLQVASQLQQVADQLQSQSKKSLFRFIIATKLIPGLYLWGGVGRGKSFLMDSFFDYIPSINKKRVHFHRFMQEIHRSLQRHQGQSEPMSLVAKDIASEYRLLCLDEFHVTDITDAMLMRRLLEGLMAEKVILLTTSNFHPQSLYEHGLQRKQFMPAIDLIMTEMVIVNVDLGVDYRLRELEKAGTYHIGENAENMLNEGFMAIAKSCGSEDPLEIEDRLIHAKKHSSGVVWFDFNNLCAGPRGKPDYIELARRYHTVLLSGVPQFTPDDSDKLRRFVWLVDEFYDRRVKLMLGAVVGVNDLVASAVDHDGFQAKLNDSLKERLASRLTEMQTHHYLSQPHLP